MLVQPLYKFTNLAVKIISSARVYEYTGVRLLGNDSILSGISLADA